MKINRLKQQVREEQLKELYDGCRSSVFGSIIIAVGIFLINAESLGSGHHALSWIYLVWIVASLRGFDAVIYFRSDKKQINSGWLMTRFTVGTLLVTLSWGLLFWNTYPSASFEYKAFIILIEMAIISFATNTLYYHLGILFAVQLILFVPIEISLVKEQSLFYSVLSIWVPLYVILQFVSAMRINRKYTDSISYQLDLKGKNQEFQNLQYAVDQHGVVSITDVQGKIIYANSKMEEMTQYSREELIGKDHRLIKSDEHAEAFWQAMYQTIENGKVWHAEVKNRAKNGAYIWMDSTVVPFLNEQGKPYQYISIRTDITKQKELEQKIINDKNEAFVRAEISQILQGQTSLKDRMLKTLAVLSKVESIDIQNKLGVFLLPEGAGELKMFVTHGKYSDEFLHQEKCVKLGDCLCGRCAVSGEVIISDNCFTDPAHEHQIEGMEAHGHYIVPLRHNAAVLGVLFIYTDTNPSREESRLATLTFIGDLMGLAIANEQVKNEMDLARRNAEDMAQTKSDFLANMSHEIRTPMNGVLGMLELLNHIDLDDQAKSYVDIAHGSANMLLNVINDILDISKIESGKLHIEHIEFDLRKSIEDSTELLSKLAYQKNIELSCFIPPATKTLLKGDVMRLQQVLNNLISNAIKFTAEGDVSVIISTLKETDDNVKLRFEIKDTGIGIPLEKQQTLFDAFTQADTSTSREYGGTGLGLTISKSLVEMMGGEMGVISEQGKGSTFWFEISFETISRESLQSFSLGNLRILTIDDNETNCLILRTYIENWGGENLTETIPEIGLYRLQEAVKQEKPFDILLLDMQMPNVSGMEVAAHIRSIPMLQDLKIILLSSMGLDDQVNDQQYFDLSLNKPIRQSLLYDAIATVQNLSHVENKRDRQKKSTQSFAPLHGKVLFVDDNAVNQHLGKAMLKTFHLDFEIASNGKEAVEARQTKLFDVILMDCQMPVMDGFIATKEIRTYEKNSGIDAIPIIALTANAMQGDREKCLSAGMDDYLSKPYTANSLFKVLAKWLPEEVETIEKTDPLITNDVSDADKEPADQADRVIDLKKFNETHEMMGDEIQLIIDAFIETGDVHIAELTENLKRRDFEQLRNIVHALKGSCGVLGIVKLYALCKETEEKCRLKETNDIHERVKKITQFYQQSVEALQSLTQDKVLR